MCFTNPDIFSLVKFKLVRKKTRQVSSMLPGSKVSYRQVSTYRERILYRQIKTYREAALVWTGGSVPTVTGSGVDRFSAYCTAPRSPTDRSISAGKKNNLSPIFVSIAIGKGSLSRKVRSIATWTGSVMERQGQKLLTYLLLTSQ